MIRTGIGTYSETERKGSPMRVVPGLRLVIIVAAAVGLLFVSSGAAEAAPSYDINQGPNTSKRVVLTYDDCPKTLKSFKATVRAATRLGVALVFFPTGDCIKKGKFDAKYARKYGHYVFNHSVSHPELTKLSLANIKKQLGAPGVVTNYGRAPYGALNATVRKAYAQKHMRIWLWTMDTNDWRGKSRASVVKYVIKNAKAGDTVLMHMQHKAFNATAIRQIKAGLAKRGLKLCRPYRVDGVVSTTPVKLSGNLHC